MKKFILFLIGIMISFNAHATTCTLPYANELTDGFIFAGHWNANASAIMNCLNNQTLDGTTNIAIGGIQTSNISNLAVTDAKIFGITTAGKVNASAITQLNNLPSGAGTIPEANIAKLDSSGNGVDGGAIISGTVPVAAISGLLGAWTSPTCTSAGTPHQAATDGMFSGVVSADKISCLTDSAATPTTVRSAAPGVAAANSGCSSFVKKNDYYMVTTGSVGCTGYFIPLGS